MMRITPECSLKWVAGSSQVNVATDFIRQHYFEQFGARLTVLMPWILMLCDGENNLLAACGVMPASQGSLFLEQYLDKPAETSLHELGFDSAHRNNIVEAGNFAAVDGASARVMYAAVCLLLNNYHFGYIMFTGTQKIRNIFARLHLMPVCISTAEHSRLAEGETVWGRYYQHTPQVMAGDLAGGQKALAGSSLLLNLFGDLPAAPWERLQESLRHAN